MKELHQVLQLISKHPVIGTIIGLLVAFMLWKRLTVSGNISTLVTGLTKGSSRRAEARLVRIGRRAIPALRAKNSQLVQQYAEYVERLKTGPSANPYENYGRRSDSEKRYRQVMEEAQSRVINAIEAIEGKGN